jgi:Flp pilus assembly protein TadG
MIPMANSRNGSMIESRDKGFDTLCSQKCCCSRGRCGQAIVEFALVLPVALWMLVGAVDFGRFVVAHSEAAGICQDAARYGRQVDPETGNQRTVESVKERVWSSLPSGVTSESITKLSVKINTHVQGMAATEVALEYTTPCLMPLSSAFFSGGMMKIRGKGVFVRDQ